MASIRRAAWACRMIPTLRCRRPRSMTFANGSPMVQRMTDMKPWFSRVLLVVAFLVGCAASPAHVASTTPAIQGQGSAASPASSDPLDQPLPVDARVKVGKLANGLTYFILPHKKPEKRAQFWLVVNAGSVLEDDDQ